MEAVIGAIMIVMLLSIMLIMINATYAAVMRRRYLHRERMAAIEKGLPIPEELLIEPTAPERRWPSNHTTTIHGIVWAGLGLGLIIARASVGYSSAFGSDMRQFLDFLGIWAYPALIIGIGLLVYAYLIRKREPK